MQLSPRSGLGTTIAILILVVSLGSPGCSKSNPTVSGNVSYQGKPLKGGTIRFVDSTGKVGLASIDQNGNYSIDNPPLGEVKIIVETSSLKKRGSAHSYKPPADYKGSYKPHNSEELAERYVPIPSKYENIESSDLKRVIKSGKNEFNFVLEGEVEQPLLPGNETNPSSNP